MFVAITARRLGALAVFIAALSAAVILSVIFLRYSPPVVSAFSESRERVLIIDAGHGGEDGGAVSPGGLIESGINLDVAQRLDALAGFLGIRSAMTRDSETIEYPDSAATVRARKAFDQRSRLEFINSFENAALISIHQNKYSDSRVSGPQVFFASVSNSRELAKIAQQRLADALCPESRRVAAPIGTTIFIMKNVECPAILVECAFLSNPREAALLNTPEYRQKIALALISSYIEFDGTDVAGA